MSNPNINAQQLAEQLTMAGLEVEAITPAASNFHDVVVGAVLEVKQHPDADRLRVCQVNVGADQPCKLFVVQPTFPSD